MSTKVLAPLLIALAFVGIVIIAVIARSRPAKDPPTQKKVPPPAASENPGPPTKRQTDVIYDVPNRPLPPPAPPAASDVAIREGSIKTQLRMYRQQVARGSKDAQTSLLEALKKNRETALRIAREELAVAKSEKLRKSLSDAIQVLQE